MGNYYLDVETTGLDPKESKIVTIQWQELDRNTGRPAGPLNILKEWELGEKGVLEEFARQSPILDPYEWAFVPVGYNLTFEHNFLKERSRVHGLPEIDILNRPFIDLRVCGVIMNGGEFKGSGLDKITRKARDGKMVPEWYAAGDYDSIIAYICQETGAFTEFCEWLYAELPEVLKRFKEMW